MGYIYMLYYCVDIETKSLFSVTKFDVAKEVVVKEVEFNESYSYL